jgi:hypothetical protein
MDTVVMVTEELFTDSCNVMIFLVLTDNWDFDLMLNQLYMSK